jgi:hypothetical protein
MGNLIARDDWKESRWICIRMMQESMSRKAADALEEVFGGSAAEGAPRT